MKRMIYVMALLCCLSIDAQKKWTLQDCINYAMENSVSMKLAKIKKQSAQEDALQSKAALLPTLTVSTSQGGGYSPFDNTAADKVYYNGSYGVNAQWTVWNGWQNTNTARVSKLTEEQADLSIDVTANSLQEQITKLYVQILYTAEAIEVNRQNLETSKKNEERGQQMVEVGKMSKADLAQLTAQRVASEYSIVESETQLSKYKLQLKQVLDLKDNTFDVAIPTTSDQQALEPIPTMNSVYEAAMAQRPEIKNAQLDIEKSKLQMKIAKAGKLPSVTLNGGLSTSTNSLAKTAWGSQMKNNVGLTATLNVSIPIFDARRTKTNINKAHLEQEQAQVQFDDEEHELYTTIEGLWLDAVNNQQKFTSASASVESEQQSYNLLSEQFNLGLKNIVELMNGKDKLLTALQNKLQSKYQTILSQQLLKFYQNGTIKI